ncbi:hypothetical protein CRU98_03245 [Arcobacter sp. CECT 8986]|uniref:hypothetical protein n=1 Tax=Arcobacter sp. CECT 8986 TaxID=2044507 RepID=UPI001009E05E|nr:hypothetical protein [Arcobacter sp. CECT 8986]RXK00186.1 hypothetical protein CRU98_03245 [Arcobacter sp. CECT 8986]
MKRFLLLMLSLSALCFASSQKGKIDMHGGQGDSLITDSKNSFKKQKYNNFSNSFMKEEKKMKKEIKKNNKIEIKKNRG